ncbi:TPA: hypothetical protein DEB00_01630 [Candidatus Uhrbacteria bacterium]|nr:hypothetical protein [Candidatus Uhrbacteria bacterium]
MSLHKLSLYLGVPVFALFAMMLFGVQSASAATYYWVGLDNADWTVGTNWASADPASCDPGANETTPTSADDVIFDADCDNLATTPATSTSIRSLTLSTGYTGTVTQGAALSMGGDMTIASGATLNSAGFDLSVGSDWTNGGIYTSGANTVTFTADNALQTITTGGTTASFDFNNVVIANSTYNTVLATNAMMINGTLTINSGALLGLAGQDLTVTGTYANNAGTLKMTGNETLTLTAGMDTDSGTTLFYDAAAGADNLNGLTTFYNLTFDDNASGSTWTMPAGIDVNGAFTITDGTLDAAGFNINVAGNWTNAGTFTSGSNTVTFDGTSGTQTIVTGGTTAGFDFNNLAINNTGTAVQLSTNAIDVDGTFTITDGTFDINALNLTVVGVVSITGTLKLDGSETVAFTEAMDINSGTVIYDGAGTYTELKAGDTYYNLTFNGTGQWTLDADLNVDGSMTITDGIIITGGNAITVAGDWSNSDTFTHGDGTVTLDGTSTQTLIGSTTFYALVAAASAARTLELTSGDTFTVASSISLNGANASLLSVEATTAGTAATIARGSSTESTSFLSLKDVTLTGTAILCDPGCINRGNNSGWIIPASEASPSNGGSSTVTTATLVSPGSGSHITAGTEQTITYSIGSQNLDSVALYFSTNAGQTYTLIEGGLENTGSYVWTVPSVDTLKGMLKVAALNADGAELISDESGIIVISTTATSVPDGETPAESFGGVDMVQTNGQSVHLDVGGLFRGETLSGVYMVNADGTRSVFPTEKAFFSYGYSFSDVVMVNDDQLSALALGARVTMAEGELVKIQSDNRVFYVGEDAILHHVPSEAAAVSAFGANWASLVTDISVVFWGDYMIGSTYY